MAAVAVVLAVFAAGSNAVSSVLQHRANQDTHGTGSLSLRASARLLHHPVWLVGIAAMIASFGFQASALQLGQLSLVQPLMVLELPITLVISAVVMHASLGRWEWLSVAGMTGGLALLLYALLPIGGGPQRASGLGWLIGTGATSLAIAALVVGGLRLSDERRSSVLGAASGACYGLTAAYMASAFTAGPIDALVRWQTYAMVSCGIAAVFLEQNALQAGPLAAAQPGLTMADPVVSIVLGVLLFHEHVREGGGWLVLQCLGGGLMAAGTIALVRSPLLARAIGEQPVETAASSTV